MTMPAMPYEISVSINPLKRLVVLWLNGFPCPLTADQAVILEGMLREARQTIEWESADGLADKVARQEGEGA